MSNNASNNNSFAAAFTSDLEQHFSKYISALVDWAEFASQMETQNGVSKVTARLEYELSNRCNGIWAALYGNTTDVTFIPDRNTEMDQRTRLRAPWIEGCSSSRSAACRKSSPSCGPNCIPHHLCTVVPPTFSAAMPVGAVTATSIAPESKNCLSSVLLPVPAWPVRNTFPPVVAHAMNRSSGVGSNSASAGQVVVSISVGRDQDVCHRLCELDVAQAVVDRCLAVGLKELAEHGAVAGLVAQPEVPRDRSQTPVRPVVTELP